MNPRIKPVVRVQTGSMVARFMRVLAAKLNLHVFLINARPLESEVVVDDIPSDHEIRYLSSDDIEEVAEVSELNLPRSFLEPAFERGDLCIAYYDNQRLVSYFWCGFTSVPMEAGLWVRVPPYYSYAYKALTVASHRGRHLQHRLTTASDRELVKRGLTHNIEYIAIYNSSQRIASARYGNQTIGWAGYFRIKKYTFPFRSPAVKAVGFEFFDPNER